MQNYVDLISFIHRDGFRNMTQRCWKYACNCMNNDAFMKKKRNGIDPRCVPIHLSFIFAGTRLQTVCSNVGNRHAEENMLRALKSLPRNKPIRVFVTKVTGHAMSRPCVHCTRLLQKYIPQARVYYTNYDGILVEDVERDTSHVSLGRQ